jgi:hypothetical protein
VRIQSSTLGQQSPVKFLAAQAEFAEHCAEVTFVTGIIEGVPEGKSIGEKVVDRPGVAEGATEGAPVSS